LHKEEINTFPLILYSIAMSRPPGVVYRNIAVSRVSSDSWGDFNALFAYVLLGTERRADSAKRRRVGADDTGTDRDGELLGPP
jgi:hypothetical protein